MNVDEMMSDRSSPAPGQMSMAGSETLAKGGPTWDTKKFREEYEVAKSRLSDQKFNASECSEAATLQCEAPNHVAADYPDPLLPR